MQAYLRRRPRVASVIAVAFGASIVALDTVRLRHAHETVLTGAWGWPVLVGLAVGAGAFAFSAALLLAARPIGQRWARGTLIVLSVPSVLAVRATHPRGDDTIVGRPMFEAVVAVDTSLVLLLALGASRLWRAPVPDFDAVAFRPARHGRRWKRRSAARRPGRPGGR